jgi:phosphopantetheine--protein transferase-like protein
MELNSLEFVTNERLERIRAFIRNEDKARSLVSGLLLRRFCGVTDEKQLYRGENGKPYLKGGNMYFNISHSGNYAVLAAAQNEVGVDIEKVAPYSETVAARCFTPAEQEWLRHEGNDEAFYRLWTAKESVMKASGLGFSLPPETFCVLPPDSSAHHIDGRIWFLDRLVYDGHIICRAIENKDEKTEFIFVSSNKLIEEIYNQKQGKLSP